MVTAPPTGVTPGIAPPGSLPPGVGPESPSAPAAPASPSAAPGSPGGAGPGGSTTCPPGGATTPAGGTCVPCTTGDLEVIVKKEAICWDTGPDGLDAEDQPLEGAEVTLSRSGVAVPPAQTTDDEGKVIFRALQPGDWEINASKTDYDSPGSVTATVTCRETASATTTLTRQGLECDRKHPQPEGTQGGPCIWMPVFWIPWCEPWILLIRDTLWLAAGVCGIVGAALGNFAISAYCAAFFAYFSTVTFGAILGVILMVLAFLFFGGVIATFFSAVAIPLGVLSPDPLSFSILVATWVGFLYGLIPGRLSKFAVNNFMNWLVAIIAGVLGGAAALICILLLCPSAVGLAIGAALLGLISAFVSGLLAHAFMNDGKTKAQDWSDGAYLLPYEGQRYCVQGLRGFISHYGYQEYSYDWAIPTGEPVLCAREGHIIRYKEDRHGTAAFSGNETANYVEVQHRDGSIAQYLHGEMNGVTSINPDLAGVAVADTDPKGNACMKVDKPVYVREGQILCKAGNVGISMFSHIHFTVLKQAPANRDANWELSSYHPVKFQDEDVDGHGGVCYSMRKYQSSNLNRGSVEVP